MAATAQSIAQRASVNNRLLRMHRKLFTCVSNSDMCMCNAHMLCLHAHAYMCAHIYVIPWYYIYVCTRCVANNVVKASLPS